MANLIPSIFTKISESGISEIQTIKTLKQAGYQGFLIGEYFIKEKNPANALRQFINQLIG